jgi:hypothetical protein
VGRRISLAVIGAVVLALGAVACGGSSETDTTTSSAPTTTAAVTTAVAPTVAPATTAPVQATVSTAKPVPAFGAACQLGSLPDCIDPDGDGKGVYLEGGAACIQMFKDSPGLCSDLDGDGKAGYPDSG